MIASFGRKSESLAMYKALILTFILVLGGILNKNIANKIHLISSKNKQTVCHVTSVCGSSISASH